MCACVSTSACIRIVIYSGGYLQTMQWWCVVLNINANT